MLYAQMERFEFPYSRKTQQNMMHPHPSEPLIFKGFFISCTIVYSVSVDGVVVKIVVSSSPRKQKG